MEWFGTSVTEMAGVFGAQGLLMALSLAVGQEELQENIRIDGSQNNCAKGKPGAFKMSLYSMITFISNSSKGKLIYTDRKQMNVCMSETEEKSYKMA